MVIILHLMQRKCLIFAITILFQYQKSKKMYERDLMKSTKFLFLLLYSFLFIYAFLCAMHTVLTWALYFSSLYLILFYYVFWNSFIFPFFSEKIDQILLKSTQLLMKFVDRKSFAEIKNEKFIMFRFIGLGCGKGTCFEIGIKWEREKIWGLEIGHVPNWCHSRGEKEVWKIFTLFWDWKLVKARKDCKSIELMQNSRSPLWPLS